MKYNPYSVSKLGTYNQCPRKFKLHYVDKVKTPFQENLALIRGSFVHSVLENNFNYNIPFDLTEVFTQEVKDNTIATIEEFRNSGLGRYYSKLIKKGILEEDFGFKIIQKNIELCDFNDPDAWCRGSADLYIVKGTKGLIADWKTGKDHSEDEEFGNKQGKMYAIYLFTKYPNLEDITTKFVFVEHSTEKTIKFYRKYLNSYIKDFYIKTKVPENDTIFKENVSALCDYCQFYEFGICKEPELVKEKTNNFMDSVITF